MAMRNNPYLERAKRERQRERERERRIERERQRQRDRGGREGENARYMFWLYLQNIRLADFN
jgi:hypothetical protein